MRSRHSQRFVRLLGLFILTSISFLTILTGPSRAASANYDFENLSVGALDGQDNWAFYAVTPNTVNVATPTGTGNFSTKDAATTGGRELVSRANDGNFAFPAISATGVANFQADLRGDGSGELGFGLLSGSTVAFRFYTYSDLRQFEFIRNSGPTLVVSFPSRIGSTDWLRVRVEADLSANSASMYYQDLTLGDTGFSSVAGPFTFLSGGTPAPSTWNAMMIDLFAGSQVDNLKIESFVPEPASLSLILFTVPFVIRRRHGAR